MCDLLCGIPSAHAYARLHHSNALIATLRLRAQVGQRYGLPLLSPVDDAGRFTDEAGPFAGLNVQSDGNEAVVRVRAGCRVGWLTVLVRLRMLALVSCCRVAGPLPMPTTASAGVRLRALSAAAALLQALEAAGVLLKEERYEHKYPYDWRTKKPTIFRATDQVRAGAGVAGWQRYSCMCHSCATRCVVVLWFAS